MTEEDDSHYQTYPQGFSKRDVYQLKKKAFLFGRKRLDPTQEIDEVNETEETKLEHSRPASELVTSTGIAKEIQHQPASESAMASAVSDVAAAVAAEASSSESQVRARRKSAESGRARTASATDADSDGGRPGGKRSSVRQFFDNFRPRARSENPRSMSSPKRRAHSGDADGETSDVEASATLGVKKRSKSPMGSLVNRLKLLATDTGERRRRGGGIPPVQGLPHPSDIPLDTAYLAHSHSMESGGDERRVRLRKNSYPPNTASVQLRHKDLFENLSHTADIDGQCCIQSATAMAESRHRRMSGPSTEMASQFRKTQQQQQQQQQHQRTWTGPAAAMRHRAATLAADTVSGSAASGAVGGSSQDVQVTENDKYIIFRSKCQGDSSTVDFDEVRQATVSEPSRVFEIFSQKHRCYDLIPTSSKLLVFDHNLNVKKAFFALVYNGLRAAPVWDSDQQRFVGMLTITDFINILHNFYRSALVPMEELESHRISTWRAQLQDRLRPFLWISPEASLLDAVRLLLHARVHRLPVVEPRTGNALFILTHKRILKYIYLYMHQLPMPPWLDASLRQLRIGTYEGIRTITESTPLVKVLSLFVQHRISALPVVGPDGRLSDIYSKFDVINLAATKTYNNLDVSVKDALQYRRDRFEGVTSCQPDDSLRSVLEKLVTAEVHRLVIVDSDQQVIGVVSLSDILKAIVLDHKALAESLAGASAAGGAGSEQPMETE
ncbi:hypothetical protein BOX15_Mlig021159g1 [Macrostomum lignano]|uniref:CBS domain-containing protein n=2 Tax=Macrostomum lignano TaxID=282301 RepID=A0A267G8U6_9PLAT|nr:hypothetical protein BOX15_Mlig021159g1 [Macrostomum lignano]